MPGSTTLTKIYWIYVLESLKGGKRYIGYSPYIKERLIKHNKGEVVSTRYRRPLRLIYLEGYSNEDDAKRREKYLKTTGGRRFLAKRLKLYYFQKRNNK
jgi:putative endonuclease